jgi:hypothetical protein
MYYFDYEHGYADLEWARDYGRVSSLRLIVPLN